MKKITSLMALILAFSLLAGCNISKNESVDEVTTATGDAATESTDTADSETEVTTTAYTRDLDAAYASFEPDTVIATVNGEEIFWDEYFYHCVSILVQIEQYGAIDSFNADFGGMSYAEYIKYVAENNAIQYHSTEQNLTADGITLSDDALAYLDAQLESDVATYSPDGTEEGLFEYLETIYTSRDLYEYFNYISLLYSEGYSHYCGENAELVTDEEALEFGGLMDLVVAKHILLSTVDAEGEHLTEDEKAEQYALAEQLIAELQAADDIDATMDALIAEYSEDPGSAYYPDGYCFSSGEMVTEFEDATRALEIGGLTAEPVTSTYGYHIILRGELEADSIVMSQSMTLREIAAADKYSALMYEWMDEAVFEYADGIKVDIEAIFDQYID